jgi:EAL domain-containing protein (putative c-di-GMP-specific phosphodiesterase class I)
MYNSELRDAVLNISKVNRYLRRSVPTMRGFHLLYQPQVDRTGTVVAAEALLRWDPQCGHNIGPNVFIPSLERSRLIVPVGQWVIEQSLAQLKAWRRAGVPVKHIGVNVSARQLLPGFAEFVMGAVESAKLKPRDLVLELTESQAVADSSRFADTIRVLTEAGYLWEIDDFGTGYASMRWMRRLSFAGLKIDRSLLIATDEPPGLIRGICAMAREIDLRVTCEGVETQAQWDQVIRAGVHRVQGYLTGRPVEASAFPSKQVTRTVTGEP